MIGITLSLFLFIPAAVVVLSYGMWTYDTRGRRDKEEKKWKNYTRDSPLDAAGDRFRLSSDVRGRTTKNPTRARIIQRRSNSRAQDDRSFFNNNNNNNTDNIIIRCGRAVVLVTSGLEYYISIHFIL